MGADDGERSRGIQVAVMALGTVLFLAIRLQLFIDDFPNPDIAGIAYNADVILDGGLPYVETHEVKAPGSFFLAAAAFGLLGRSIGALLVVHTVWLLLGAPAVWIGARAVYDDARARLGASIAVAVYLLYAGMFTYNYSSWMMPTYAWAFAAAAVALRRGDLRWAAAAGAATVAAFVTKHQAATLALLLPAMFVVARRRAWTGASARVCLVAVGGGVSTLVVLAVPYLARGELAALARGLFPVGVAGEYVGGLGIPIGLHVLVWRVVEQLAVTFPLPAVLGVLALAGWRRAPGAQGTLVVPLLFLLASILGAGLGGARFYLHYLVQYVPALAILAAHPGVTAMLEPGQGSRARWARASATVALAVALGAELVAVAGGEGHRYEAMARRLQDGRTAAQAAGAHIHRRTAPGETIYAWGWTAWPVYFWADRRAVTPVYKSMGTLTTFNTNGAFFEGRPVEFRPGPRADALALAFEERRPAYFIYSSSYLDTFGCEVDPLKAWTRMGEALHQGYVAEAQYGDLIVFGRR